jgi:glycosyltransferase involved in cell wall biosynthesis
MLPSAVEGWSLALMEAIAAGCVCIASDVGGARDLCCDRGAIVLIPSPLGELDDVSFETMIETLVSEMSEHRAHIAAGLRTVAADYPAFAARVTQSRARLAQLCDMRAMTSSYLDAFTMAYRGGASLV